MSRRDGDVYLNIKFTARRYQLLKWISEELRIPFSEAVAFALIHRLVPLARGVKFFKNRIEPAPGSRLASEDIWTAFIEWCNSHRMEGQIGASDFVLHGPRDMPRQRDTRQDARQPSLLLGRSSVGPKAVAPTQVAGCVTSDRGCCSVITGPRFSQLKATFSLLN